MVDDGKLIGDLHMRVGVPELRPIGEGNQRPAPLPRFPEDSMDSYTITAAVAEHYQVPRHTAQGWVRRLRTAK